MIIGYVFDEQERASLEEHGWDPDLFESVSISRNWLSFCYDEVWFLNKRIPARTSNLGELIGRRLKIWINNPTHQ